MLKSIKREFLLNRNSLWQSLAVLGGAWLLGEALSLCIMYFAHEEEYFSLGTVFAAIMLVMFGFNVFGDGLRDALDPKMKR